MGNELDLRKGIYDFVNGANIITLVRPNIDYDGDYPYCKFDLLPAPTKAIGVNNLNSYSGIIQLLVHVEDGTGEAAILGFVDQLIDLFPRGTQIKKGSIKIEVNEKGWSSPAIQEDSAYMIPVSIPYKFLN